MKGLLVVAMILLGVRRGEGRVQTWVRGVFGSRTGIQGLFSVNCRHSIRATFDIASSIRIPGDWEAME